MLKLNVSRLQIIKVRLVGCRSRCQICPFIEETNTFRLVVGLDAKFVLLLRKPKLLKISWEWAEVWSWFLPCGSLSTHLFPMHPFSTSLKTSENLTVFWCFQGAEKGCIGNKGVNRHFYLIQKLRDFVWKEEMKMFIVKGERRNWYSYSELLSLVHNN